MSSIGPAAPVGDGTGDGTGEPAGEDHADRLLDRVPVAAVSFDAELRMLHANHQAERMLGLARGQMLGRTQWELFPATRGTELEQVYRRSLATGEPATFVQYYPPHDRWYELDVRAVASGLDVVFHDVTALKRPPSPAAIGSGHRTDVGLLTEVTEALTATLDADEGVRRLARLVVPRLGHWSIVSLVDEHGLHDMAVAHHDPGRQPLAEAYADARIPALTPQAPARQSIGTGEMVTMGSGDPASVELIAGTIVDDPDVADLLRRLQSASMVTIPLTARGRVAGLLSLYRDVGTAPWTDDELDLAREVAARAGMALDNARLYAERRHAALVLQEALLTPLPEPDHLELRARYVPAARDEKVGGDWYDALLLPTGTTALVIGDVTGHDIDAAAAMGQIRTILRTLAWEHSGSPAAILSRLDRAMAGLRVDVIASCLLMTVEQTPAEAAAGLRRVRWSSAGHLPPVVLGADGGAELLGGDNGPLLGVQPDVARDDHEHVVGPGATLLLYTDGLVERRDRDLTIGLDSLLANLSRHGGHPLSRLIDLLVTDLAGPLRRDDVAVLGVRFHPENRPRPAEAGPADV
ncbi:SpoIIE family protein phosphatase [uncultured Cellulomonas sp.]|uniref:SpoIIE family protein phosphatase n=1 Tax=uncultured Cellulomonas sp. TaxID=189682 RepID=UPI00261C88F4|nr:SpoIIE family protein phosphatase [uncultured Cellulomonas sp.]